MRKLTFLLALIALGSLLALGTPSRAPAADPPKNKRLLLVTHSGGFIHGSVATAEELLKEIGSEERVRCHMLQLHRRPREEGEGQGQRTDCGSKSTVTGSALQPSFWSRRRTVGGSTKRHLRTTTWSYSSRPGTR